MLVDYGTWHENNDETQTKMLSDDEFQNFAYVDRRGYLHLCQSKDGNRLHEIELHPYEVRKLQALLNTPHSRL